LLFSFSWPFVVVVVVAGLTLLSTVGASTSVDKKVEVVFVDDFGFSCGVLSIDT
jgi:hypothetical protein